MLETNNLTFDCAYANVYSAYYSPEKNFTIAQNIVHWKRREHYKHSNLSFYVWFQSEQQIVGQLRNYYYFYRIFNVSLYTLFQLLLYHGKCVDEIEMSCIAEIVMH